MPSQTTLNITFNKPSNTGAAGVDNYKIYKGLTYATATNLIYDTASDSGWSGFQDPEVYTDTSLIIGDVVTYKIEFIRSSDGAIEEQFIGPYLVPGSSDIGYPNNQPSHDSGFPYFVSVEPLCHFRADSEYATHGDHTYGDTVIRNQASSYSDFSVNGLCMRVKLWTQPDGTQTNLPILSNVVGGNSNTFGGISAIYNDKVESPASSVQHKKNMQNYIKNPTYNTDIDYTPLHQIYSKLGIPHSNMDEIYDASRMPFVLDEGITTFSIISIKADPLDATTGAPSNNTALRYAEDWHGTWAGLGGPNSSQIPAYTSTSTSAQRARKWSDGDLWVDPSPPFGISNTMDPGYINITAAGANGHEPYIYRSGQAKNLRMSQHVAMQLGDVLTPFLPEINKLHFVVTRQNGDGTNNTVWIDGKVVYHQDLSLVHGGMPNASPWAASAANLADPAFMAWLDEIDRLKISDTSIPLYTPFVSYPTVGLLNYPLGRAFQSTFAENMIFDQTLSNSEMYRAIFYFQNKFNDYLAPQDGTYDKL